MIQLKCYDSPLKLEQTFVDLYEDSPIKLTLSVEDITNAEATSVFSKAFRIPNTPTNAKYFKHAFLIEGIDFDVTVTKPAEILVDGSEFRTGNIRLQKIFNNRDLDRIDYEILFLGETKDFSTSIGNAFMCDLDIEDLTHVFSFATIQQSWLAFPESSTLTAGLNNGNVLYPLINHGNSYNENGVVQEPEVSVIGNKKFTSAAHQLLPTQFKPMVRVKRLWDAIFEDAGYTYDSEFINPATPGDSVFSSLYASAFGNEASIGFDVGASSKNTFSAIGQTTGFGCEYLDAEIELSDLGNNYSTTISRYGPVAAGFAGLYTFTTSAYLFGIERDRSPGGGVSNDTLVDMVLQIRVNGVTVATSVAVNNATVNFTADITLAVGDTVRVYVDPQDQIYCSSGDFESEVTGQTFACTQAPGNVNPVGNFDCEYKQIDFIKDVLTTFRLVMSPDYAKPFNFIIEPFVDYVGSGETHDWSDKLMLDKDLIVEPLFFTQSDVIDFKHAQDGDYINTYHLAAYKQAFGYLEFDSNNDLLKGSRNIETKWAPTPMTQIEGAPTTSQFILPQLHVHEAGDDKTLHLPIKSKTRFLFYNGMQSVGINANRWYLDGAVNPQELYPLVSYSSDWPMTQNSTVLNWNVDIGYWGNSVSGYPSRLGQSMYDLYWSGYINSLYNKNARRVTGNFILNNVDLQDFSFDDIIYVNGVYYRPEKIFDVQIGVKSPTKVQLIKIVDNFVTVNPPEPEGTMYFAEIYDSNGCTLVADCYPTSAFPNLTVGTVMKADLVDQSGTFEACVRVGQTFSGLPPQGAATGTLQDGATYFDCEACQGEAVPSYTLEDCNSGQAGNPVYGQVSSVGFSYNFGQVVQYQIGGVGATYCGTIVAIGSSLNTPWTLTGVLADDCQDPIVCSA